MICQYCQYCQFGGSLISPQDRLSKEIKETDKTDKTESVQTGDKSAGIIGGSIAAMISALGCIVIAARKREEKCETK